MLQEPLQDAASIIREAEEERRKNMLSVTESGNKLGLLPSHEVTGSIADPSAEIRKLVADNDARIRGRSNFEIISGVGGLTDPTNAAKALQASHDTGASSIDMIDAGTRAAYAKSSKLTGLPPEFFSQSKTASWLSKNALRVDMTDLDLGPMLSLEDKLRKAEAEEAHAKNLREGKAGAWGVAKSMFASTAEALAQVGMVPDTVLRTLASYVGAGDAYTSVMGESLRGTVTDFYGSMKRAQPSGMLKDPKTGEEFIDFQSVNPTSLRGLETLGSMVAGEAPVMGIQLLLSAITGGAATPMLAPKVAGLKGAVGAFAATMRHYMTQPAAIINTGRVIQGQAFSGVQELMQKNPGMTEAEAWHKVAPGALLAGLLSGVAGSPLEAKFIEDMFSKTATIPGMQTFLRRSGNRLMSALSAGFKEGTQEVFEGVGEDLAAFLTYSPDKTMKEFAANALQNFAGGFAIGGPVGGVLQGGNAIRAANNAAFIDALHDPEARAAFIQHAPSEQASLVKELTKGGELETLAIDSSGFVRVMQSQGLDPLKEAQKLGVKAADFEMATKNGGDLIVDTSLYAKEALSPAFQAVKEVTRAYQGGPTLQQLQNTLQAQNDLTLMNEAMAKLPPVEDDPARLVIRDKVAAQIKEATRVLPDRAVEELADHYSRVLSVLAQRSGKTTLELFEKNKLGITRGVHKLLDTKLGENRGIEDAGPEVHATAAQVQGTGVRGAAKGIPGQKAGVRDGRGKKTDGGLRRGSAPPAGLWHGTTVKGLGALKAEGTSQTGKLHGGMGPGLHLSAGPHVAHTHAEGSPDGVWQVGVRKDYTPFDAAFDSSYSVEEAKALGLETSRPLTGHEVWVGLIARAGSPEAAAEFLQGKGYDGLYYDYGGEDAWSVWKDNKLVGSRPTTIEQAQEVYSRQGSRRDPVTGQLSPEVRKQVEDAAQIAPGAEQGIVRDELSGDLVMNLDNAAAGIADAANTTIMYQGISTPGVKGKILRGTQKTTGLAHEVVYAHILGADIPLQGFDVVGDAYDQASTFAAAEKFAANVVWLQPTVRGFAQGLRYGANAEGFYGNEKMAFPNAAYPQGRNTWDIPGCGREAWAVANDQSLKAACYGGACYAEALKIGKQGKSAGVTKGINKISARGEDRASLIELLGKEGFEAARQAGLKKNIEVVKMKISEKQAQLQAGPTVWKEGNSYFKASFGIYKRGDGSIMSLQEVATGAGIPAVVTTDLKAAKGQDIRLGVDTDGAAWLTNPKVLDALLAAGPRSLSVYSSAYHAPPPAHPLSGRTMINVTISGWHPIGETLSRLKWAEEARANGWNVILREVVADPAAFGEETAGIYNRMHEALLKTDFYIMQQPLHIGRKMGQELWGLPGCCKGSEKNAHTCDQCEVAEGLGQRFQNYWGIAEEDTREEKVLPDTPGYKGVQLTEVPVPTTRMNQDIATKAVDVTSPEFLAWFGLSKALDMNDEPLVVYHGSTSEFSAFDRSKANFENDLGTAFYFTTDASDANANYAGEGPDLTNKIAREAERIASETDREYDDPGVLSEARKKFSQHGGSVIPAYLKIENPVEIGGENETFLDLTEDVDEDGEPVGDMGGSLLEFLNNVEAAASEYNDLTKSDFSGLIDRAYDEGGLNISVVINFLRDSDASGILYSTNDQGDMAANEIIRHAMELSGFDGVIDRSVSDRFSQMEGMRESTTHYLVFNPTQIKSAISNTGEFDPNNPNIMMQKPDANAPRGYLEWENTRTGETRQFNMVLLGNENKSTVFHELGHFYLEVMRDLAAEPGAAQQLKDDVATVMKFYGKDGKDEIVQKGVDENGKPVFVNLTHERFADAHLLYLEEGKAPDPELKSAFKKFSKWLSKLGEKLTSVDVKMTDEVRGIFDRLYATDRVIEEAQKEVTTRLFSTAEQAQMSQAEFNAYTKSLDKEFEAGKEIILRRLMREMESEDRKEYRDAKAKVEAQVEVEVMERPEYYALVSLSEGVLEDGVTPIKLARQALVARYGEEVVRHLARDTNFVYTTDPSTPGVMDADSAATLLGFETGDELINALTDLKPRLKAVEEVVAQRMQEREPSILRDEEALREAAIEAMNGELRGQVLALELGILRKKEANFRPVAAQVRAAMTDEQREAEKQRKADEAQANREANSQEAKARREARVFAKISSLKLAAQVFVGNTPAFEQRPDRFLALQRRAAGEAYSAALRNDYKAAAEAKEQELLNHFLYRASLKSKDNTEKFRNFIKWNDKPTVRANMGKAGGDFLAQFDALRDRFSIERLSNKKIATDGTLAAWTLRMQNEAVGALPLSDWLADETNVINYRELTSNQLVEVYNELKNIKHLAYMELGEIVEGKHVSYEEMMESFESAFATNLPMPKDLIWGSDNERNGAKFKLAAFLTGADASLVKIQALVNWIDKYDVTGPAHRYIWHRISKASGEDSKLTAEITDPIIKAMEAMPKEQRTGLSVDHYDIGLKEPMSGKVKKVNRGQILTMLLYSGQEDRLQKLLDGYATYGLTQAKLDAAFSNLTSEDFAFAETVWASFDKLKPLTLDLEQRITGIRPEWKDARPFEVYGKNGELKAQLTGGYFPLVADPKLTGELGKKQEGGTVKQILGSNGYGNATTSTSHTKNLTKAKYPLLLDFQRIATSELANQIKDITHREAVLSVNRIFSNERFSNLMKAHIGEAYEAQLMPWLVNIASDRNSGATAGMEQIDKVFTAARGNVVAAALGYKLTSIFVQVIDPIRVMLAPKYGVSPKHFGKALVKLAPGNPDRDEEIKRIKEMSPFMAARALSIDRDMRERINDLRGDTSAIAKVNRTGFAGLAAMDSVTSWPAWLGSFNQSMERHGDVDRAIKEADRTVEMLLQGGLPKDLTPLQAQKHWAYKMITMFMGDATANYNMLRDAGHNIRGLKGIPTLTGAALIVIMSQILGDLIKGQPPEDDETYAEWLARKAVMAPLSVAPVVRDVAGAIDSELAGKPFTDYRFSPAVSAAQKVLVNPFIHTIKLYRGKEDLDDYILNLTESTGYAFGVGGTVQATNSAKYLVRYAEGSERPDNAGRLLWDLYRGKKKEKK